MPSSPAITWPMPLMTRTIAMIVTPTGRLGMRLPPMSTHHPAGVTRSKYGDGSQSLWLRSLPRTAREAAPAHRQVTIGTHSRSTGAPAIASKASTAATAASMSRPGPAFASVYGCRSSSAAPRVRASRTLARCRLSRASRRGSRCRSRSRSGSGRFRARTAARCWSGSRARPPRRAGPPSHRSRRATARIREHPRNVVAGEEAGPKRLDLAPRYLPAVISVDSFPEPFEGELLVLVARDERGGVLGDRAVEPERHRRAARRGARAPPFSRGRRAPWRPRPDVEVEAHVASHGVPASRSSASMRR